MRGRLGRKVVVDGWLASIGWLGPGSLAAAWWLALGALAGAVVQRTHFCTMGAIADALLMRSPHRARAWAAAIAVVALAATALHAAGVPLATPPSPGLVAAILGGAMMGFGMVLAGGCPSRNLVRIGTGSLRAVVVVLVIAVAALIVTAGPLGPAAHLLASLVPLSPAADSPIPALVIGTAAAGTALLGDSRTRARRDLVGGLLLGAIAALSLLGAGAASPGLNPMLATETAAATLLGARSGGGPAGAFACLPLGFILGSALAAERSRRIEAFAGVADTARHLTGAALMGLGGGLVGGCTLGHGVIGIGLASPASLAVTFGILAGAVWALRYLETGGLVSGLAALLPGRTA